MEKSSQGMFKVCQKEISILSLTPPQELALQLSVVKETKLIVKLKCFMIFS